MNLSDFISLSSSEKGYLSAYEYPWQIVNDLSALITEIISHLSQNEYDIQGSIAIHKTARIESAVTIKDAVIIGENCEIKAGAYLRSGLLTFANVVIGANCEVKQSIIFQNSSVAHLNYVGNSIIGKEVNIEAGAILANHFNERENKEITVKVGEELIQTQTSKFGSLVGDYSRIGANAVLNPGTILPKKTIVNRLTHIDQLKR